MSLTERLEELSKLEPNWDGYGAKPISASIILDVKRFFRDIEQPSDISCFPCNHGGIQLEAEFEYGFIEIEFYPTGTVSVLAGDDNHDINSWAQKEYEQYSPILIELTKEWIATKGGNWKKFS